MVSVSICVYLMFLIHTDDSIRDTVVVTVHMEYTPFKLTKYKLPHMHQFIYLPKYASASVSMSFPNMHTFSHITTRYAHLCQVYYQEPLLIHYQVSLLILLPSIPLLISLLSTLAHVPLSTFTTMHVWIPLLSSLYHCKNAHRRSFCYQVCTPLLISLPSMHTFADFTAYMHIIVHFITMFAYPCSLHYQVWIPLSIVLPCMHILVHCTVKYACERSSYMPNVHIICKSIISLCENITERVHIII